MHLGRQSETSQLKSSNRLGTCLSGKRGDSCFSSHPPLCVDLLQAIDCVLIIL
jgi:hypothetical protein